ncbi:cytochrome P450 [Frankia sp. CNm7]|uniref:Cytochrome P450 n=1 Tax=Frankia nepalensis TaxID=1836974 RepID=A0A937UVX7_9ACTN|nr:cytochrome P450 [Frankia nepalensis]MBL7500981.1 cytochrome P450 [Frankia nepalensis]MBL7512473.1 cytochrome P450 [Frankia nepalensis]MBL7521539.1 cytochrome P450 [Frankia nepalensis]MBL7632776.1 cytochrome P450 [Frankia nepalensis]
MNADEPLYWDPYDAGLNDDFFPVFTRIREESPLYRNEKYNFYALSRFADLERAIPNPRMFLNSRGNILELIQSDVEIPPGTLIFEDPPVHTIHRKLLSRVFTPRRIAELEPKVRQFCARALDPVVGEERFDLVTTLANDLPMWVIGMLLGIPEADQRAIREIVDGALRTGDGEAMDLSRGAVISGEIFASYIDWRRDHPSDDLMTDLLGAEFEDENGVTRTLTRDEVLTYVSVVAGAGNETTGRLIGWIGVLLARHPDQRRELAADPSLVPNAVEETLRYEPTGPVLARYVAEDVEFHGQTVPAGSALLLLLAAANRDPRQFDDPDAFDIHRRIGQQLTFGLGLHYCLGAALARLEGRVACAELLRRFPDFDIDWTGATKVHTSTIRGWDNLPLVVG